MTTESALQATLAAEHAAVWVYGVLGGQTSLSGAPTLFAQVSAAYVVHRQRRDTLTSTLRQLGMEPVAAETGYQVPDRLGASGQVRAVARELERGCASVYAALVAETSGDRRAWAVDALADAAVRELSLQETPRTSLAPRNSRTADGPEARIRRGVAARAAWRDR